MRAEPHELIATQAEAIKRKVFNISEVIILMHIYIYMHAYIYMHTYMLVLYMCVCSICVCARSLYTASSVHISVFNIEQIW